jgi:hypothetical protein
VRLEFELDQPTGTALAVRARGGNTQVPDSNWSPYTAPAFGNVLDLADVPADSLYLEAQFNLSTTDATKTPALKSAKVVYECLFEK